MDAPEATRPSVAEQIRERRGDFDVDHREFFLFPTVFHEKGQAPPDRVELTLYAQTIIATTFRPFEFYIATAVIYLRVPVELRDRLRDTAEASECSMNELAIEMITNRLDKVDALLRASGDRK